MKKYIGLLLLFSLLSSPLSSQVPDGYVMIPIETVLGWQKQVQEISLSLSLTEMTLKKSQDDLANWKNDITLLQENIENWEKRYRSLTETSELWLQDFSTLNQELLTLRTDFEKILESYKALQVKLEKVLKQLKGYQTSTVTLAGTSVILIILLILVSVGK